MKGRATKIVLVIGVLLVLGGGAVVGLLLQSSPEKTVKDYLKAAARGDEARAKALLSADATKRMAEMESAMAQSMPMGGIGGGGGMATKMLPVGWGMKVRVGKAEIKGEQATVNIHVKASQGAGGKTMPSVPWPPVRCVREKSKWRLDFTAELQMGRQMMAMFAARSPTGSASRAQPQPAPSGTAAASAETAEAAQLVAKALDAKRASHLQEAAGYLREALRLDAGNVDAHWALAWVLADLGNKAGAIAEFEEVVRRGGGDARVAEAQAALSRLR